MGKIQGYFYNADGQHIQVEVGINLPENIEIDNDSTLDLAIAEERDLRSEMAQQGLINYGDVVMGTGDTEIVVEWPGTTTKIEYYVDLYTNLCNFSGLRLTYRCPCTKKESFFGNKMHYFKKPYQWATIGLKSTKKFDYHIHQYVDGPYYFTLNGWGTDDYVLTASRSSLEGFDPYPEDAPWFLQMPNRNGIGDVVIEFMPNNGGYFYYNDPNEKVDPVYAIDPRDISDYSKKDVNLMFYPSEDYKTKYPLKPFHYITRNGSTASTEQFGVLRTCIMDDNYSYYNKVLAGHPVNRITSIMWDNGYPTYNADDEPFQIRNKIQQLGATIEQFNSNIEPRDGVLIRNFDTSIKFSEEPVVIEENLGNTFDPVIKTTCSINLLTQKYLGDLLWCGNVMDNFVSITGPATNGLNGRLFKGYLKPNTYTQPFANFVEEITLNAVDTLTILDDIKYKQVTAGSYSDAIENTFNVTFRNLLLMMRGVSGAFQNIFYDGSLGADIFDHLAISENYLFGDTYKDCMTYGNILEEMMRYLNLHIKQIDGDWYIFHWDSLKHATEIDWYNILTNNSIENRTVAFNYITADKSAANDANITIEEVYNKIQVKCDLDTIETIIDSPLDSKSIQSLYPSRQLYCKEYLLEHKNDGEAMRTLLDNQHVPNKVYTTTEWYVQVMYAKNWTFNWGYQDYLEKLRESPYTEYQFKILADAAQRYCAPLLLNLTKVTNQTTKEDSSQDYSTQKKTQLYFAINGQMELDERREVGQTYPNKTHPTDNDLNNGGYPFAIYKSPRSGSILSPTDNSTTNYLVFSGKLIMMGTKKQADGFGYINGGTYTYPYDFLPVNWFYMANYKSLQAGGNSMYTRRVYNPVVGQTTPLFTSSNVSTTPLMLQDMHASYNDKDYKAEKYKYNWTYVAKREAYSDDRIQKIPIFECELTVGNKRLIEENMDSEGNSTFRWVTIGQEPTVYDYDETGKYTTYKNTTFSLGINPKIDDFLIGQEYELQNTVKFEMNIDAKGTAIPIRCSDMLTGKVEFKIVGIYPLVYDDVDYRHGTWFRKKKFTEHICEVMANVRNIVLTDFKCEIYSDNGGNDSAQSANKDLIYISDTNTISSNTKDDIEFKFVTQPSGDECIAKGIKNSILKNAVIYDSLPLKTITLNGESAKPEEHYINSYYEEYSSPKLILEQTLHGSGVVEWSRYKFTMLDKEFYIINKSHNVMSNTITCKFKEI